MPEKISFVTVGRITRPHGIRGQVCAQYYADSFSYLDKGQAFIKTEKSAPKPCLVSSWKMQNNTLILKLKGVDTRTDAEFLRNYDIVINASLLEQNTSHKKNTHENTSNDIGSVYDGANDDDDAPFLHHIIGAKAILQSKKHSPEASIQKESTQESTQESAAQEPTQEKPAQESAAQEIPTQESVTSEIPISEELIGIIEEIIFPAGQELWVIKNNKGQEILFPAVSDFIDHYDLANNKVYINPPAGLLDIYLSDAQDPNKAPREKKKRQNAHKNKPLCGEGKKQSKSPSQPQSPNQPKRSSQSKSPSPSNTQVKN